SGSLRSVCGVAGTPMALVVSVMAVQAMSSTIVSLRSYSRISAVETHMTKPHISGIAPFFIVKSVPAALAFYRDRLGFDITFQGPEPNAIDRPHPEELVFALAKTSVSKDGHTLGARAVLRDARPSASLLRMRAECVRAGEMTHERRARRAVLHLFPGELPLVA